MGDIPLVPELTDVPKKLHRAVEGLVNRIAARAVVTGRGNDLLLMVYAAGLLHGSELAKKEPARG